MKEINKQTVRNGMDKGISSRICCRNDRYSSGRRNSKNSFLTTQYDRGGASEQLGE